MDSLLPYYERELTFLRRLSHDFARSYPKVAGRLLLSGEACDDPHIERLIESFAFLAARVHKKLDDDFPEITDSLLQVIYPQCLRPFPSVSIAHFDTSSAGQLSKTIRVPRNTMLSTRPVNGLSYRFRTTYDVDLSPLKVISAGYENVIDSSGLRDEIARLADSALRIELGFGQSGAKIVDTLPDTLRFFLSGEPAVVGTLREAIFSKAVGIWMTTSSTVEKIDIPADAIKAVGFEADEVLLDEDARVHRAHQLLLEYFVFPEKFNFVEIDLTKVKEKIPPQASKLEIRIGISGVGGSGNRAHLLDRIGKENLILGCTPVVNLFRHNSEPIRITGTSTSYPVLVDTRRPQSFDVYEIKRVLKVGKKNVEDSIVEFKPFYSLRHAEASDVSSKYWHPVYKEDGNGSGNSLEISLIDPSMDPREETESALSLELSCTNRDLPSQLPFGLAEGDLFAEGGGVAKAIRFLRKPSREFRFPNERGERWRLVSHLALSQSSLVKDGADAIKEMLTLYDIARAPANSKQISGILDIEQRPVTARISGNPFPIVARGLEIRITVDESHYAGVGIFMFAQVLDRFFALYANTNSFTRLIIVSRQTGEELIKCAARNGETLLV